MPLVYILAKKRDQMGYIIWGVILIAMSLVIFNIMGFNIYAAVMSMTLFSIGEIINFPLSSSLALGRSNPNNRGQYMGLYSMAFSTIKSVRVFLIGAKSSQRSGGGRSALLCVKQLSAPDFLPACVISASHSPSWPLNTRTRSPTFWRITENR